MFLSKKIVSSYACINQSREYTEHSKWVTGEEFKKGTTLGMDRIQGSDKEVQVSGLVIE